MGKIDLHLHTIYSDGQYSPEEIVRLSADQNMSLISITDHDSVAGLEEGAAAALESGIRFLSGIEISVSGPGEVHILGYNIDSRNKGLLRVLEDLKFHRQEREKRIYKFLSDRGLRLTEDQVKKEVKGEIVGRSHFAIAMVKAGYVSSIQEAFDLYLGIEDFKSIDRPKPSPKEGIELIRKAGGVPVLAHPSTVKLEGRDFDDFIKTLETYGLQGIECYYSSYDSKVTEKYIHIGRKHKLLITGGSDFHGENIKPDIHIGMGINGELGFSDDEILNKIETLSKRNTINV